MLRRRSFPYVVSDLYALSECCCFRQISCEPPIAECPRPEKTYMLCYAEDSLDQYMHSWTRGIIAKSTCPLEIEEAASRYRSIVKAHVSACGVAVASLVSMPFENQKRCQLLPAMIVLAVVSARDTITDCDGFVAEKMLWCCYSTGTADNDDCVQYACRGVLQGARSPGVRKSPRNVGLSLCSAFHSVFCENSTSNRIMIPC